MYAEVTFIHPRKCMYRESKMSLVIANIPVMFPSCKLGSKSNVACATLWDTLALLHSRALQGKGRRPTPDCAADESPSPISPNGQKRSVQVTGFLPQLCGEFLRSGTALGLCSSNSYSRHSRDAACFSPHLQTKGGLCTSHNSCRCEESWQRADPPSGCSPTLQS